MKGSRTRLALCVASLLGALGGCTGPSSYEADLPEPESPAATAATPSGQLWVVKPGDTLYSIAFSAGTDWRELAASNGIGPPFRIYPGQQLRLSRATAPEAEPERHATELADEPAPPLPLPSQRA